MLYHVLCVFMTSLIIDTLNVESPGLQYWCVGSTGARRSFASEQGATQIAILTTSLVWSMIIDTHNTATDANSDWRCRDKVSYLAEALRLNQVRYKLQHWRTSSVCSMLADTHNTRSWVQQYRVGGGGGRILSRRGFASQPSTIWVRFWQHLSLLSDGRHSQHCNLTTAVSGQREHTISAKLCEWTKCDSDYNADKILG